MSIIAINLIHSKDWEKVMITYPTLIQASTSPDFAQSHSSLVSVLLDQDLHNFWIKLCWIGWWAAWIQLVISDVGNL